MDPLSALASVIAVYQLASEVGKIYFNYAQGVRHANRDSDLVLEEISKFQRSLQNLKGMLTDEDEGKGGGDRLKNLRDIMGGGSGSLQDCKRDLEKTLATLESGKLKEGIRAIIRKLAWPMKEGEVKRVVEKLRTLSMAVDTALTIDTVEMVRGIDNTTKRIESSLQSSEEQRKAEAERRKEEEAIKIAEETRESILNWLTHPDPWENHNIASHARNDTARTGRWFIDGVLFEEFKNTSRSQATATAIMCGTSTVDTVTDTSIAT